MSEKRSYGKDERELAREIFIHSIAVRLGAGESQLNARTVAIRAFNSAQEFFDVQSGGSQMPTINEQHLEAARKK